MTSIIQVSPLREQRLRFIKAHQMAFETNHLYPLGIFEDFILQLDDAVVPTLEASCKIEADRLWAARFLAFIKAPFETSLALALQFYHQVEAQPDIKLNDDLLQRFLGNSFDFSKVTRFTLGLDLRDNLADSSLKMHFILVDYPEKIATALELDGRNHSDAFRWIAMETVHLIGFDFYFDGRCEIELYAALSENQFQQPAIRSLLEQSFSTAVLNPLQCSDQFYTGISKANIDPVLYYHLKNRKDLLSYFSINETAQQVHAFYQHQEVLSEMWVGVTQSELEKSRIDQIRLYYYQSFGY